MTIARLRDQQALGPRWVSHILQRLVFEMWSAPETARIIEEAAKTYAARREKLIACLAEHGMAAFGVSGLHVWVPVAREAEAVQGMLARGWRSEEHTSELQSLMRISYAVFCLKTKNQDKS